MKNKIDKIKYLVLFTFLMVLSSCSEDFLTRNPEDALTVGTYYQTDAQVQASTNGLYGIVWFDFNNKFWWACAEIGSGNGYSLSSDVTSFRSFEVTPTNDRVYEGWSSLFGVVAQSNEIIKNLNSNVGAGVTPAVVNNALGEAHFMRALAYFYLVRLWGPVPIIEDGTKYTLSPQIRSNYVEDVYQFIENDLNFAVSNLYPNNSLNGRVSMNSAKAMLAKVYLYEKKYDLAKQLAKEVIDSGQFKLYGTDVAGKTFGDLFLTANNNNEESIAAIQCTISTTYGTGNSYNEFFAYTSDITSYGGWGVLLPSLDLMSTFESGDQRRKETYMLQGDYYAHLAGGWTVPATVNNTSTGGGIKKYVVGKSSDNGNHMDSYGMFANNIYFMRFSEVYLIYAEAIMAGAQSTTDAQALAAVNKVRNRAGLSDITGTLTFDQLFHERRVELAIEGDYWFDLCRIDRAKAISIISSQNRGDQWTPVYFTPTSNSFILPYPNAELTKDPYLDDEPVHYTFN